MRDQIAVRSIFTGLFLLNNTDCWYGIESLHCTVQIRLNFACRFQIVRVPQTSEIKFSFVMQVLLPRGEEPAEGVSWVSKLLCADPGQGRLGWADSNELQIGSQQDRGDVGSSCVVQTPADCHNQPAIVIFLLMNTWQNLPGSNKVLKIFWRTRNFYLKVCISLSLFWSRSITLI